MKFLEKIICSCHDTTILISLEKDRQLIWREQLMMKIHMLICSACRQFYKNTDTLSKMMKSAKNTDYDKDS